MGKGSGSGGGAAHRDPQASQQGTQTKPWRSDTLQPGGATCSVFVVYPKGNKHTHTQAHTHARSYECPNLCASHSSPSKLLTYSPGCIRIQGTPFDERHLDA